MLKESIILAVLTEWYVLVAGATKTLVVIVTAILSLLFGGCL